MPLMVFQVDLQILELLAPYSEVGDDLHELKKLEVRIFCRHYIQVLLDQSDTECQGMLKLDCFLSCLLYTSDAADDTPCVDLGGRRIIKKKISNT